MSIFKNKSILITGGTGSFGKKITEVILKEHNPKKLIIFSRDELKQSEIQNVYNPKKYKNLRFFIGDVRDLDRLVAAFQEVDIVIHAAALKQVTTAEYNPIETIKTNIAGTENVVKAANLCGVQKVIALSTDKAANPVNLYGATKLVSEKLIVSANNFYGNNKTRFSVVRYGNVMGSRGSVVPVFKKQINDNIKSFTITSDKMTRFWMTLRESVNFVISSLELMKGGEIFIPKLPSIKITDLAKAMDSKKSIKIIGVRPGEKLSETLCSQDESILLIEFKKYFISAPSVSLDHDKPLSLKFSSFIKSKDGENGRRVKSDFSYTSSNNSNFLSIKEIKNKIN